MSNIIKVISAGISAESAVLYTEDGQVISIPAGDPRIPEMLDQVYAAVKAGNIPVMVDISTYSVFAKIEKESKGFLKFFRVAKSKVQSILGIAADRGKVETSGGISRPVAETVQVQPGTPDVTPTVSSALAKAHREAEKQSLPEEETTVVAVVGDTPIVGAEKLTKQAQASVRQGNTLPFQNFLKRIGFVAKDRKHTAQEALIFCEKMDLPPALDGSIISYKSLRRTDVLGVLVDNHSGKVKQGVGTFVQMDAELVDDNRRVLCSNGFHVPQRGYLGHYGSTGNHVICLIKIAPEDIISVPLGETQKMRVRAYHILAELSEQDMRDLRDQKSITKGNDFNSSLLGKIVSGDHIGITHVTTEHPGKTFDQMIPIAEVPEKELARIRVYTHPDVDHQAIKESKPVKTAGTLDTIEEDKPKATAQVDVAALNQKIVEDKLDEGKVSEPEQKKEQAADNSQAFILYGLWFANKTLAAWEELMAYKKANPFKSWKNLGLTDEQASEIGKESSRRKPKKGDVKLARKTEKQNQKKKGAPVTKPIFDKPKETPAPVVKKAPGAPNKVRQAFDVWKQNKSSDTVEVLKVAKKEAKKSWAALGFSAVEIAEIEAALKK